MPEGRAPTPRDWAVIAADLEGELTRRIETMTCLRDDLTGCIGCGCVGMAACPLWNAGDAHGAGGAGARLVERRTPDADQ